ncbi:MAG TPA: penicillin acylase family protein [Gemmatimonadaceae bacterium]
MNKLVLLITALSAATASAQAPSRDVANWERQARNVTIVRDDWGIAHVFGKTDADAVFGLMYAQAEDDFNRVETNYINAMGRLAETEGEAAIYQDLRMKIFIDPDSIKAKYATSPGWLRTLMIAWADGLNYYLYKNPQVKPRVIAHFEPWMALTFSEGSIGGDIETVSLRELAAFYGKVPPVTVASAEPRSEAEPGGSNGIAIAPSNTLAHHALFLINPHTTFFFRAEVQAVSDEGLNVYGAATWGQFFVYQGFNNRVGWMHTSSGVDDLDEYLEAVVKKGDRFFYRYGTEDRPVTTTKIIVPYRTANGMAQKEFIVYRTHHGPVVRSVDGKWVTVRMMQEPVKALTQSYLRTKARSYKEFRQTMELHTNSSNNTVFADADGDIAYFHGNFIPRRDPRFDWTKPVDGSNPATEWGRLLSIDETPHLLNPASGWLYNSNNWPWSAAGASSPKRENFPAYVETGVESDRGRHAIRVLSGRKDFTLNSLISAAYDSYLTAFENMIPPLVRTYDGLGAGDPLKGKLSEQISMLRSWDYRWSATSVPTSLAVFWGEEMARRVGAAAAKARVPVNDYIAGPASENQRLDALAAASDKLAADFGTWKTPWGDINRFQRLTGDILQPFNDSAPSIPVGFTSARWGSLASFAARVYPGTKKWYGTSGNSFVAVVEFGDSVRAKAITAGGESGNPSSPHFNDQASRYSTGGLRDVYFYRSQLKGHTQREYHPGS